jgi:3-oxoacyl-[acyl-carrier-protein] synthase II
VTRIAITGLGAATAFGAGVEAMWQGIVEGRRAMSVRPELAPWTTSPVALAPKIAFSSHGRAGTLATLAVEEAVADAGGLRDTSRARIAVTVGTTLGSIDDWLRAVQGEKQKIPAGSWAKIARIVDKQLGARGPVQTASVACASSNAALGLAQRLLSEGSCDVAIAGGADALNDFVVGGFQCLKALSPEPCRPFARTRTGLNLGEGAAFLVLETERHARARGAKIRAFFDGYGSAADAVHMTGPDKEGRGAARAILAALANAKLDATAVDHISAHGTATVFNDLMEAKAFHLAFGERAVHIPVTSLKGALGHALGASGALEAVAAVCSLETGLVPPTAGLDEIDPQIALDIVRNQPREGRLRAVVSTSSGFGGTNAAIVLTAL